MKKELRKSVRDFKLFELFELFDKKINASDGVSLIDLSTTDGFNIYSVQAQKKHIELDKLAAVASSIYALSNASTQQLTGEDLEITTVESKENSMLFLKTYYQEKPCVLSLLVQKKMPLGEARYIAKFLDKSIKAMK